MTKSIRERLTIEVVPGRLLRIRVAALCKIAGEPVKAAI